MIKETFYKYKRSFKDSIPYEDKHDRYEDRDRLMGLNRYIAKRGNFTKIYLIISAFVMLAINYLIKIWEQTGGWISGQDISWNIFQAFMFSSSYIGIYLFIIILLIITYIKFAYNIRMSHKDLNVGQKGTARWTTRDELDMQYKKVDDKARRI